MSVNLYLDAIDHWRDAKGIGTALIPKSIDDKFMVLGVLQKVYNKSPTCNTVIVVPSFAERSDLMEFLTHQENEEENNAEFKELLDNGHIKVFTQNYMETYKINKCPHLCILFELKRFTQGTIDIFKASKFKLVIINELLFDDEAMVFIYQNAPILPDFKQKEIDMFRMRTPVEETQIPINLFNDEETKRLLDYYTEYITTSITIFGSFEVMQNAHSGNTQFNISAMQTCKNIAYENGWNEHLDMSVEFNVEIDKLYNPNSLKERATSTYEMIRNRNQLVSDYKGKLEAIYNIVNEHRDKKILIISKRGEFATEVTNYLNTMFNDEICLNYHDKVDNIPAVDLDGNPIYYKTGERKGQRKMFGSANQKRRALAMFNKDKINVLSTNNSPDKKLDIAVDIIIITSPMCEELQTYIYRLPNLNFRDNKLYLFSLYCQGTNEQRLLEQKSLPENHIVKNDNNDEIFSDFVIAD